MNDQRDYNTYFGKFGIQPTMKFRWYKLKHHFGTTVKEELQQLFIVQANQKEIWIAVPRITEVVEPKPGWGP